MVAKSIAKMYTNIHKPTDYCLENQTPADMPPGTDCPYPIRILAFLR